HPGMHDLVAPSWRRLCRRRRVAVAHHHLDLSTQASLVKLESGGAITVESEIWIQTHERLLVGQRGRLLHLAASLAWASEFHKPRLELAARILSAKPSSLFESIFAEGDRAGNCAGC